MRKYDYYSHYYWSIEKTYSMIHTSRSPLSAAAGQLEHRGSFVVYQYVDYHSIADPSFSELRLSRRARAWYVWANTLLCFDNYIFHSANRVTFIYMYETNLKQKSWTILYVKEWNMAMWKIKNVQLTVNWYLTTLLYKSFLPYFAVGLQLLFRHLSKAFVPISQLLRICFAAQCK